MRTKIQRWGNSQGIRLPRTVIDDIGVSIGQDVEIFVDVQSIIIKPASSRLPKASLAALVKKMPKDYHPSELSWGTPQGMEAW